MNIIKSIFLSCGLMYAGSSLPSSPGSPSFSESPSEQYSAAAAASSASSFSSPTQAQTSPLPSSLGFFSLHDQAQEQYSAAAAASSASSFSSPTQEQGLTSGAYTGSSASYQWPSIEAINHAINTSALQEQINRQHQDNVNLSWQNRLLQEANAHLEKTYKCQDALITLLREHKNTTDPIAMKTLNQSQAAAYSAASGSKQAQPAAAAHMSQHALYAQPNAAAYAQQAAAAASISQQTLQAQQPASDYKHQQSKYVFQSQQDPNCPYTKALQEALNAHALKKQKTQAQQAASAPTLQPASAPAQQLNPQLQTYHLQLQQSQLLRDNSNKKAKRKRSSASAPAPRTNANSEQ